MVIIIPRKPASIISYSNQLTRVFLMAHLRMFHLGNQRFCGTHDLGTLQIPAFSGFKKPATVFLYVYGFVLAKLGNVSKSGMFVECMGKTQRPFCVWES